mmetsp:Transcript_40392/g.86735  ORF Transcript_40392/g.86735 Transcript_40392/m.86735 type:complete len:147 (+) Transcript_40392:254-694(+)
MLPSPGSYMAKRIGRLSFCDQNDASPVSWGRCDGFAQMDNASSNCSGQKPRPLECYNSVQGTPMWVPALDSDFDVVQPPNCGADLPATYPPLPKKLISLPLFHDHRELLCSSAKSGCRNRAGSCNSTSISRNSSRRRRSLSRGIVT